MINTILNDFIDNIEKVILGKRSEIFNLTKGILANGHILIEDMPGVGKTMLVKAICKSLDLEFSRVQFTPDLLPTDITGVSIFNPKTREFEFKPGPVFSNIVLADEINRASPKTQSALLEAMEEKQVSESNTTYKLSYPFLVLATQNPIEHEGTFPLPDAQLDRFLMKVNIGYPDYDSEVNILKTYRKQNPLDDIDVVCKVSELLELQEKVKDIKISDPLYEYIIDIVKATRNTEKLHIGSSVRGSLALMRLVQAEAFLNNRDYVIPDDVKKNASLALSHRVRLSPTSIAKGISSDDVIKEIMQNTRIPQLSYNGRNTI